LKKVAFILEEDDIYSALGGNSLTITLHDILKFGFKTFTPTVIGMQNEAPFPSGTFVPLNSPNRRSYLADMRAALKHIQPDVVVSLQSFRLAFLAKSWEPKIPVVLYRHNLVRKKGRLSALAFNYRLKRIDRFIFCSHFIRDHFVAQYPKTAGRADTVWNGFELDTWHPAGPTLRKKEIVLAGRCHVSPVVLRGAEGHNVKKTPYREAPSFRARSFNRLIFGFWILDWVIPCGV